jgi:hypothetical protein
MQGMYLFMLLNARNILFFMLFFVGDCLLEFLKIKKNKN